MNDKVEYATVEDLEKHEKHCKEFRNECRKEFKAINKMLYIGIGIFSAIQLIVAIGLPVIIILMTSN